MSHQKFATSLLILVASGLVLGIVNLAEAADAPGCPQVPDVAWWKNTSHEKIVDYVDRKHGGDWRSYIEKWQVQREHYHAILNRGTKAVFRKANVTLSGQTLAAYIDKVDKRIAVSRCLAARASSAGNAATSLRQGDSVAGRAKATASGCMNCHGDTGISAHPMIPNLAGQHEPYLQIQLARFRTSPNEVAADNGIAAVRHDRIMTPVARTLTDGDIEDLSAFFAGFVCVATDAPDPKSPAVLSRCVDCHGTNGASERPHIPNLAGQKQGYLIRQLELFRHAGSDIANVDEEDVHYQETMAQQGRNLTDQSIGALAIYFSSLPCQ